MKKVLSILLTVAMVLSLMPMGTLIAGAETEYTDGYYTYIVTDGEATITAVDPEISGDVTIPSTLGGFPVTGIDEWVFYDCSMITDVTIPEGIESIGEYAFYSCHGIESISIPDSATYIGEGAFSWCANLKSINIPDGITDLEAIVFSGCTSLESITIPDSVTSIGWGTFSYCESLTSVTIPDSVTYIGFWSFEGCINLEKITLPFIGAELDGDVDTHFGYIFAAETPVDHADYLPSSLKEVIITKATSIGEAAFYYCDSITSITLPDSVTSIGDRAFGWCENLTSITIPDGVTSIGEETFIGCLKLTTADLGAGVTSIGLGAFEGCISLTSVTIPDTLTNIEPKAFFDCQALQSITLPDSVTNIAEYAFLDSGYYLNENNWENGVLYIGNHLIKTRSSLGGAYTVKDGTITIANFAFAYLEELTSVTIPSSVSSISIGAFVECLNLTDITIPSNVTFVDEAAFEECTALADVWYIGSENDRENLEICEGNDYLTNTTWHYNTCADEHSYINRYIGSCSNCEWERDDHETPSSLHLLEMQQNVLGVTGQSIDKLDMNADKMVDSTDLAILQILILGL